MVILNLKIKKSDMKNYKIAYVPQGKFEKAEKILKAKNIDEVNLKFTLGMIITIIENV